MHWIWYTFCGMFMYYCVLFVVMIVDWADRNDGWCSQSKTCEKACSCQESKAPVLPSHCQSLNQPTN